MTYYDSYLAFLYMVFLVGVCKSLLQLFKQHSFVNRGFLNGPICPIYGIESDELSLLLFSPTSET